MLSLALALISGLAWGSADFVGGVMTKRLAPATVLVVSQAAGLTFIGVLVVASGDPVPPSRSLVYGALGGLGGAIGLAALYKGLAVGRMSIVAPTAALSGAVPVIVGFLQSERPALLQLVGMAVAGVGVLVAVRTPDPRAVLPGDASETAGRSPRAGMTRGIGYALGAALFLGLFVTSLDAAGDASAVWASLMIRAVSVPLFFAAWLLMRSDRRRPTVSELWLLVVVGMLDNGANVLFALAADRGLLTLVAVLGSLYPVSTVLLARAFLRERLTGTQAAGVVAAFTGVALIAVG